MKIELEWGVPPYRIEVNGIKYIPEYALNEEAVEETPDYELGKDVTEEARSFQVGDFVTAVDAPCISGPNINGMSGKVVVISNAGVIGIEFPELTLGHNCGGFAALDHGKWVLPKHLKHIDYNFFPEPPLASRVVEEAPEFKVGDFVRVVKVYDEASGYRNFGLEVGMCGKVVTNGIDTIGVEFPEITEGHDCNGRAASGRGRWLPAFHLERIG